MTKEELLEKARRDYPVGTEYDPLNKRHILSNPNTVKVERNDHHYGGVGDLYGIWVGSTNCSGTIYAQGKWAEIISTPDKMEKKQQFEVGRWYKINNSWWSKCGAIKGGHFYEAEAITKQGIYRNDLTANFSLAEDGRSPVLLIDLSEIQQYLPDGHPDKFVATKDEEWEPKDGEDVIITSWYHAKIELPQHGKIKRANKAGCDIVLSKDHHGNKGLWWFNKGEYRKALPHEIPGNEEETEECEDCEGTGKQMEARLYPSGYTEVTVDCKTCNGTGESVTTNQINNSQLNTKQNGTNQKGIEVQRKTAKVTSGKRISGSAISGRRSRTATASGHLSYKAIIGS
jgi:hypothetical protein